MIRSVNVSIILILVTATLSAQKKNTIQSNNIKSITEYKQDTDKNNGAKVRESYTLYDDAGNILEEINYDSAGKVKTHMKYLYDAANNKIKETELTPDGKVSKVTEYKYNGNLRTEKNVYDAVGKLKSKRIYQYEFKK